MSESKKRNVIIANEKAKGHVEKIHNYWNRLLKHLEKESTRKSGVPRELYETCRKWIESPASSTCFKAFFSRLLPQKQLTDITKKMVGSEGKYRKATGNALHYFVYHYLKADLSRAFEIRLDEKIDDTLSLRPDVSIWKEGKPLVLVECKVGCDMPTLRQVAMEQYLTKEQGLETYTFVVTRSRLEKPLTKRERELEILSKFVEVHYLPIEPESPNDLVERLHKFRRSLEFSLEKQNEPCTCPSTQ